MVNVDYFHDLVWQRFVRMPYGHVIDYADFDGKTCIPTPEECKAAMPNPLGWWTPIENGAFFTGLYLYALLAEYDKRKDDKTANEIATLAGGLFLLQDIGNVEGFIARGVADDGVSHYPFSSDDQFTPWVLAVYSFYKSELCHDKKTVKERLLRALTAVRDNGWFIPCDVDGLYYCKLEKTSAWRGVCKLLLCARVIYELTGDEKDLAYYRELAFARPLDSIFTRLEIASHGYSHDLVAFLGTKQNWICTCAHFGLRELARLDSENREYFKQGLKNNGITAHLVIDDIKKYDNEKGGFDVDWRRLAPMWEDYRGDVARGLSIAMRQNAHWLKEVVPHRKMEHEILGNALFCALIAITCGEKNIAVEALKKLVDGCAYVDWGNLHLSYAFVVESGLIFGDFI